MVTNGGIELGDSFNGGRYQNSVHAMVKLQPASTINRVQLRYLRIQAGGGKNFFFFLDYIQGHITAGLWLELGQCEGIFFLILCSNFSLVHSQALLKNSQNQRHVCKVHKNPPGGSNQNKIQSSILFPAVATQKPLRSPQRGHEDSGLPTPPVTRASI